MASAYARPESFDNLKEVNLLKNDTGIDDAVVQTLEEEVFFDVSIILYLLYPKTKLTAYTD